MNDNTSNVSLKAPVRDSQKCLIRSAIGGALIANALHNPKSLRGRLGALLGGVFLFSAWTVQSSTNSSLGEDKVDNRASTTTSMSAAKKPPIVDSLKAAEALKVGGVGI